MPSFSARSRYQLGTCHSDLRRLFGEVIKRYDCVILCGHRNKADQDKAFAGGKSKLTFPHSRHNSTPSQAVDVAPWPIAWSNHARFEDLALVVKATAHDLGIEIIWGGDWSSFRDMPHWELPRPVPAPSAA